MKSNAKRLIWVVASVAAIASVAGCECRPSHVSTCLCAPSTQERGKSTTIYVGIDEAAPRGGQPIDLKFYPQDALSGDTRVIVPEGKKSVKTDLHISSKAPDTVTITATAANIGQAPAWTTLKTIPPKQAADVKLLQVDVSICVCHPGTQTRGKDTTLAVTLENKAHERGQRVDIKYDPPGAVTGPPFITVPKGETIWNTEITIKPDTTASSVLITTSSPDTPKKEPAETTLIVLQ